MPKTHLLEQKKEKHASKTYHAPKKCVVYSATRISSIEQEKAYWQQLNISATRNFGLPENISPLAPWQALVNRQIGHPDIETPPASKPMTPEEEENFFTSMLNWEWVNSLPNGKGK